MQVRHELWPAAKPRAARATPSCLSSAAVRVVSFFCSFEDTGRSIAGSALWRRYAAALRSDPRPEIRDYISAGMLNLATGRILSTSPGEFWEAVGELEV